MRTDHVYQKNYGKINVKHRAKKEKVLRRHAYVRILLFGWCSLARVPFSASFVSQTFSPTSMSRAVDCATWGYSTRICPFRNLSHFCLRLHSPTFCALWKKLWVAAAFSKRQPQRRPAALELVWLYMTVKGSFSGEDNQITTQTAEGRMNGHNKKWSKIPTVNALSHGIRIPESLTRANASPRCALSARQVPWRMVNILCGCRCMAGLLETFYSGNSPKCSDDWLIGVLRYKSAMALANAAV